MKAGGLASLIATFLLFLATVSTAWPGHKWLQRGEHKLIQRQEQKSGGNTQSSASSASSHSTITITSAPTLTSSGSPSSQTDSDSGSDSATASGSNSAAASSGSAAASASASASGSRHGTSKTSSHSTKTTPIDPRLPPGGVQLITPAAINGPQYYKVGDYVTFKWNYTSLSVTPSAIDVLASCAVNSATYTIASNMSVEETGAVTWNLGAFQSTATNPFPVASYTLMIHDAAKDVTDIPSAGYLGAYNQYIFGIYTGQPYIPLNQFKCATCSNGALTIHERQALGVLLGTSIITVLSFTWFANGFGMFS